MPHTPPEKPIDEPESTGQLFVEALTLVNGVAGGGIAVVAGILLQQLTPASTVPTWIVAVVGILLLTAVSVLTRAMVRAARQARSIHLRRLQEQTERERQEPRVTVLAASRPYPPYQGCRCVLIVELRNSPAMVAGCAVIISIADEHHERPLGHGTIQRQQSDGNVAVTLDFEHDGVHDYVTQLLDAERCKMLLPRIRLAGTILTEHLTVLRAHYTTNPASSGVAHDGSSPLSNAEDPGASAKGAR